MIGPKKGIPTIVEFSTKKLNTQTNNARLAPNFSWILNVERIRWVGQGIKDWNIVVSSLFASVGVFFLILK